MTIGLLDVVPPLIIEASFMTIVLNPVVAPLPEDDPSLITEPPLIMRLPPLEVPPLRTVPLKILIVPPVEELSLKIVPPLITIGPLEEVPPLMI